MEQNRMVMETKTGINGWNLFRNLLFLSLLVLFVYSLYQLIQRKEPISGLLPPGTESPDFSLPDLGTGQMTRLSDFRGKGVIIVFWATWCPACRSELKLIEKIQREYSGENLAVITINQDQMSTRRPAIVLGYLEQNNLMKEHMKPLVPVEQQSLVTMTRSPRTI